MSRCKPPPPPPQQVKDRTMLVDSEGNAINQYKGLKISYVVEGVFFPDDFT